MILYPLTIQIELISCYLVDYHGSYPLLFTLELLSVAHGQKNVYNKQLGIISDGSGVAL